MKHHRIEFRGSYRYASAEALDQALGAAHEQLADDELADLDVSWLATFSRHGVMLRIDTLLPATADHYLAAAVLEALAANAVEGVVETRRAGRLFDFYPAAAG